MYSEEFPTNNEMMDDKTVTLTTLLRRSVTNHLTKQTKTDCQKPKCWYVHKTQMPTSNDVINKKVYQDLHAKHVRTIL